MHKLKIALLSYRSAPFSGGQGIFVRELSSALLKRGHEVELEYSRKNILDKLNNLFGYPVVEKIKLSSFDDEKIETYTSDEKSYDVTNHDYQKKINSVKNEKIKKSLIKLSTGDIIR